MKHDYDIMYVGIGPLSDDPDVLHVFGEGPYNFFGYDQSLDWNTSLEQGLNQWYLEQGRLIMPPDSQERVQHYWDWQQYLMDKILPMVPALTATSYRAVWSNLKGYDPYKGLLNCWGKMSWDGLHHDQTSDIEVVVSGGDWLNLNPFSTADSASMGTIALTSDPMIKFDQDRNCFPHLAREIEMINDTHIRIHLREGINWQPDPENLFPNEYLDVDDVFFTYYSWKNLSPNGFMFKFIEDMKKIDQYTIDIFIDGDPSTTDTNELFAPFLNYLGLNIIPEHYLNQTQLADGITPDVTHNSWQIYSTNCFGTGLFEFDNHIEGIETTLELYDDCWWLDPTVDKTGMDFEERFGNFSSGLRRIKLRVISEQLANYLEFISGKLDMVSITEAQEAKLIANDDFEIYSRPSSIFGFFGFNLAEDRVVLGNRTACIDDSTISKGLAIRKAIAYAMDLNEINQIVHNGKFTTWYHPMFPNMGVWLNPSIIRYNHNLDLAKYYMSLAGYDLDYTGMQTTHLSMNALAISILICLSVIFVTRKIRKTIVLYPSIKSSQNNP